MATAGFPAIDGAERVPTPDFNTAKDSERASTWRADLVKERNRRAPRRRAKLPRASDGLELDLGIAHGWVRLGLNFDGDVEQVVGSAVFGDALGDLTMALRICAIDGRASWCSWNDEPGETHIVFIPQLETGNATIELWRDESELARTPRTDDLIGRWQGPTYRLVSAVLSTVNGVIDEFGTAGVDQRWGFPAPLGELARLAAWLTLNST